MDPTRSTIVTRSVRPGDRDSWLRMRRDLWPDGTEAEHAAEIEDYLAGRGPFDAAEVLLAIGPAGEPLGFVELSVRACAEGCTTHPVAYVEGWYVVPDARRRGVGSALVAAAERWGRAHGCRELASDADPDNARSVTAHRALGFEDVGLVRCFRKGI